MKIDSNSIVSISEANQNFSRVARMVEKNSEAFIFKNNKLKYRVVDMKSKSDPELTDDEKIDIAAARILKQYKKAFVELAK